MNNQGWSLNTLLAGLGVLTFALVFSVVLYDVKIKDAGKELEIDSTQEEKKVKYTYTDMEKDLVSASKDYLKEEYGKHIPEGSMRISLETLTQEGFYEIPHDPVYPAQKCTGHVTVEVEKNHISYQPYLKCGKYYESKEQ